MIDEAAAFIPLWMLMSAVVGFMMGEAVGDSRRHRKCLEEANDDLRDQLQRAQVCEEPLHKVLKQQRGVINDIHKQVVAVTKALQKRPS
jgi:hypothetical protein